MAKEAKPKNTVILVSLDGFRPDYLDRGHTPTLKRLADEGTRAQWMTPAYPTLTFPNHYTLVTGLHPGSHGIVNNTMRDKRLGNFALKNREAITNGKWWGGEPIWVTAQKQGLRSGPMFWPGSEAEIAGKRPNYWLAYDKKIDPNARVDKTLSWLRLPMDQRPHFITLYFEHTDEAGHDHGIDSPQLTQALKKVDIAMARLLEGLEQQGLRGSTNIVVTSDHGMADTPAENIVLLDDVVDISNIDVITQGQVVSIAAKPGRKAIVEKTLLGKHANFSCWRKRDLPTAWHYGKHPRVPPIICQADEGWSVMTKERFASRSADNGAEHGFDPNIPSMRAMFFANGPDIQQGIVIPAINNVDVYPFLCALLDIKPKKHEGNAKALTSAIRKE